MHKIDLNKFSIRTDLALESALNIKEINKKEKQEKKIKVTNITLDKKTSKLLNRKIGHYTTIEFDDITGLEEKENVKEILSEELKKIIKKIKITKKDSCLILGLGNDKSTPDSLGPLSVENILVTRHLFKLSNVEKGFREVSAFSPGVMGVTGIETSDIIEGIINKTKPDFIIVIDSLASQSIKRLNKTIQMTDTGIYPGSGIGNNRKEISKELLGIPVIAIGVPTVVDAVTIVSNTLDYMNDKKIKINKLISELKENEKRLLISEILNPLGYNLMVTPKEVDFIIEKLSDIIGNGINLALHDNIDT